MFLKWSKNAPEVISKCAQCFQNPYPPLFCYLAKWGWPNQFLTAALKQVLDLSCYNLSNLLAFISGVLLSCNMGLAKPVFNRSLETGPRPVLLQSNNLLAFISGVLLLDFEARDFHNVVYRLVEEFGINDDLSSETKAEVLRTLLLPHRYVDGHTSNFTIGNFKRSLSRSSLRGSMRGFSAVSHNQVTPKSQLRHFFLFN